MDLDNPSGERPSWPDAKNALEGKHRQQLEDQRKGQEKIQSKLLEGVGPEESEAIKQELKGSFEKQAQALREKQREEMDRLELLYRGPPSERDRER